MSDLDYPVEDPDITVAPSTDAISLKLSEYLQNISDEAIMERGIFYIGISGGSMIGFLKESLQVINTTFSKWKIFFNDERIVPFDSDDSTYGACKKNLLGVVENLKEENFVPVKVEAGSVEEAASAYILELVYTFPPGNWPRFDCLLLGLGEDGHTCSLFPEQPLLTEEEVCVGAVKNSPKPPPERVTFTFPLINNAANIVFVAAGEGKAEVVKGILVDKDDKLPAFHVRPRNGKVYWILDDPSARLLPPDLYK